MRKRTQARELALKCLFQMDIAKDSLAESLDNFWLQLEEGAEIKKYANILIKGVFEYKTQVDLLIKKHARNWQISRMAVVDRNILRIAIFELIFQNEVPPKVAINEAVELAKKYGDAESSKFVNGILDKVFKTVASETKGM